MCAYTVHLQAYFNNPWTKYLYYTCCKHKALCSCKGKYALYRYVNTGFKENRQSLLAHILCCKIRDLKQLLHNFYSKGIHILSPILYYSSYLPWNTKGFIKSHTFKSAEQLLLISMM